MKKKVVELESAPPGALIRYTTDGSSPRVNGGKYIEPFPVQEQVRIILAIAEKDGIWSDELQFEITWDGEEWHIDLEKPAKWTNEHIFSTTKESFNFLGLLKKYEVQVIAPRIAIIGDGDSWVDITIGEALLLSGEQIEALINALRAVYSDGQVSVSARLLSFPSGQSLINFALDEKRDYKPEEVEQ